MPNERNDQSELRGIYAPRDVKSGSAYQAFKPRGVRLLHVILTASAAGAFVALVASCPWLVTHLPALF